MAAISSPVSVSIRHTAAVDSNAPNDLKYKGSVSNA